MKKFLAIIILSLCFITSSQADDIRDFQIERMSLGDSLLDRFSKKEMNNKQKIYHYATKDYYQVLIDENIEMYDVVTVHLKENDNNFIIKNIEGVIGFEDKNKKKCENKMKEIGKSIEENLNLKGYNDEGKLSWDKTGKSDYKRISFMTPETNHYNISVICQYWHQSTPFGHVLKTSINSEEFQIYLATKAYK